MVVVAEADELDASAKTTIEALDGMVGSEGKFWRTVVGYDELILILRVHLKITGDIGQEAVHRLAGHIGEEQVNKRNNDGTGRVDVKQTPVPPYVREKR